MFRTFRWLGWVVVLFLLPLGCSKGGKNPATPNQSAAGVPPGVPIEADWETWPGDAEFVTLCWPPKPTVENTGIGCLEVEVYLHDLGPEWHVKLTPIPIEDGYTDEMFPLYQPFRLEITEVPQWSDGVTAEEQAYFRLRSGELPPGTTLYTYDYMTFLPEFDPETGLQVPAFSWGLYKNNRMLKTLPYGEFPIEIGLMNTIMFEDHFRSGSSFGVIPDDQPGWQRTVPTLMTLFQSQTDEPGGINIVWIHGTDTAGDQRDPLAYQDGHISHNLKDYSDYFGELGTQSTVTAELVERALLDECQAKEIVDWHYFYNTLSMGAFGGAFGEKSAAEDLTERIWNQIFLSGANPDARVILIGYSQGGLQALSCYKNLVTLYGPVLGRDPVEHIVTIDGNNRGTATLNFGMDLLGVLDELIEDSRQVNNAILARTDMFPFQRLVHSYIKYVFVDEEALPPIMIKHLMRPGARDQRSPWRYDVSLTVNDPCLGVDPLYPPGMQPLGVPNALFTANPLLDRDPLENPGDDPLTLTIGGAVEGLKSHPEMDELWNWLEAPHPFNNFPDNTLLYLGNVEQEDSRIYWQDDIGPLYLIPTNFLLGHVKRIRNSDNEILYEFDQPGITPPNPVLFDLTNPALCIAGDRRGVYGDGLIELNSQLGINLDTWGSNEAPLIEYPGHNVAYHMGNHYKVAEEHDWPMRAKPTLEDESYEVIASFLSDTVLLYKGPPCDGMGTDEELRDEHSYGSIDHMEWQGAGEDFGSVAVFASSVVEGPFSRALTYSQRDSGQQTWRAMRLPFDTSPNSYVAHQPRVVRLITANGAELTYVFALTTEGDSTAFGITVWVTSNPTPLTQSDWFNPVAGGHSYKLQSPGMALTTTFEVLEGDDKLVVVLRSGAGVIGGCSTGAALEVIRQNPTVDAPMNTSDWLCEVAVNQVSANFDNDPELETESLESFDIGGNYAAPIITYSTSILDPSDPDSTVKGLKNVYATYYLGSWSTPLHLSDGLLLGRQRAEQPYPRIVGVGPFAYVGYTVGSLDNDGTSITDSGYARIWQTGRFGGSPISVYLDENPENENGVIRYGSAFSLRVRGLADTFFGYRRHYGEDDIFREREYLLGRATSVDLTSTLSTRVFSLDQESETPYLCHSLSLDSNALDDQIGLFFAQAEESGFYFQLGVPSYRVLAPW